MASRRSWVPIFRRFVALALTILNSLVPCSTLALGASALERIVAEGTPAQVWATADSLEREGIITSATAAALRARGANKPGSWQSCAAVLDSMFADATGAMEAEGLSREDSVWYFALLLDEAYLHARASADSPEGHAEAEEAVLRQVMTVAPLPAQRIRATLELGRMLRYRTPFYAAPEDCTVAARRYLESVAWSPEAGDLRATGLWQLAWLEAEAGNWDRAVAAAGELATSFRGTKWENRAAMVRAMLTRRELGVSQVVPGSPRLTVYGTSRNLSEPVQVSLARIDAVWVCRHGRLPLPEEDVPLEATDPVAAEPCADGGVTWQASLPPVPPGFYRLTVTAGDTSIVSTVGMLNVRLVADEADPTCVSNGSPDTLTVHRGGGTVTLTKKPSASRLLPPGARWCAHRESTAQFIVYDAAHAGWCGPDLAGPSWIVWVPADRAREGAE